MYQNKENQDQDLEKGLLDDDSKFNLPSSSKPPDAIPLKTFRTDKEYKDMEQETLLASNEFNRLQAESDEEEDELLENRKIFRNVKKYKTKIRTFFNVMGTLKNGSGSKSIANRFQSVTMHEKYQPKWTAIHHASAKCLINLIRDLLKSGNDPNIIDERGRTAMDVAGITFYQGIHIDSLAEVLQTLLEGNGTFNTMKDRKESLDTPIHTAVELGCMESIKTLLNAEASVACLNSSGLTPLHLCIKNKQEECLKILLKYKCNGLEAISKRANTRDHAGFTVLQAAVVEEWEEGVDVLLDYGADVMATSNLPFDRYNNVTVEDFINFMYRLEQIHETPIHLAADAGNQNILRKLLTKNKTAVNKYNSIGQRPLFMAIRGGHLSCVKTLLSMGADVMNVTNENQNALHIAINFDQKKVVEFLLNRDYDFANKMVNSFDNNGYAPIHSATVGNNVDCIKLLAEKNVFMRLLTKGVLIADWTPLHIAAAKNFPEVAEVILDYDKTAIDDVDHKGRLAIHIAASRRNREVMAMLLRKGAVLSSQIEPDKQEDCNKKDKVTALKIISSELPNPTPFLEEVLDSFIEPYINTEGRRLISMDYRLFTKADSVSQIKVIEELVKYGHEKLLIHPLVESLIYLKWRTLFPAFGVIICIHILFALCMYGLIIGDFLNDTTEVLNARTDVLNSVIWITVPLGTVVILLELSYMNIQRRRYFCQLENWTKLGSVFLAAILLSTDNSWTEEEWSRHAATAALLLSWAQIMFLFSRFPNMGFYILMFGHVSLNIFKILLTFSFLILAFALCFMIQYHSKAPFGDPWEALIKTIVMMTSEFEYENIFGKDHSVELLDSKPVVHVLFILFLIFVSIVFVNFMVGVAVSDVNDLKIVGNIKRLEKQVEFLSTLDVLAFGFGFKCCKRMNCVSNNFISKRFVNSMTIKAGVTKNWMVYYETKTNDEIITFEKEISIPSHILANIFNKIKLKKDHYKEEEDFNLLREQVNFMYNFTTSFIDKFLTNEVPDNFYNENQLIREKRINRALHRLKSADIDDVEGLKENYFNLKPRFKHQSTQTKLICTGICGPKYIQTRFSTKRCMRRDRIIKRDRLLQELKSKFTEEASVFRQNQIKRFKKLEKMLKKY